MVADRKCPVPLERDGTKEARRPDHRESVLPVSPCHVFREVRIERVPGNCFPHLFPVGQPRFGEIDVPLNPPEHFVADHILIPQIDNGSAFDI